MENEGIPADAIRRIATLPSTVYVLLPAEISEDSGILGCERNLERYLKINRFFVSSTWNSRLRKISKFTAAIVFRELLK